MQESDIPAFADLMRRDWLDMVAREGTVGEQAVIAVGDDEELPCPACGTAAPLVEGACSDCGLHLA